MNNRIALMVCAALVVGMIAGVLTGAYAGYRIGYQTPIDDTVCPR